MHRHDNPLWPQLAAAGLCASLIADGHHLPPPVLKAMVQAKGRSRSILVTDAMSAATAPPGRYRLGDLEVDASPSGCVTQPGSANFAGSALTMDRAVANTVRFCELAIDEVLPMASANPARLMGIAPVGLITADWDPANFRLCIAQISS